MGKKFLIILMGIVLFIFILGTTLSAQKLPTPVGFVNDFAGVIDPNSTQQIEGIARALQEKTGAEIAVVTIDTIEPFGSVEEYAIELAAIWGIGKKGEDTGILFLLAMKERQIRIEVGYGLEGIIPDGLAGEIIDKSILPPMRLGNYGDGLLKGVQAATGIIAKEYDVDLSGYQLSESKKYTRKVGPSAGLIMFIILAFLFGGGRFFWPLLFLGAASRRGFYGGGFGSGGVRTGIGGGGFSGFSGGGFGGGGASRGF
jgi:uncharacterized protein